MPVAEEILALARVRAHAAGRAVLTVGSQRVQIDGDAAILAPLKMAGEERIWAVAFGRRPNQPRVVVAGDPRNRDDETESVLVEVAAFLDGYFQECLEEERAPQVWVASGAGVKLLD